MSESRPSETPKRKAPKSAFKPGQSGNPGGRPKAVRELLEVARAACPETLAYLVRVRDDEGEETRARLEAGKILLAYGLGAPPKQPEADPIESMSDDELVSKVREVLATRADQAGGVQ